MMSKNYHKKTSRSRRKLHKLDVRAAQLDMSKGKAGFQLSLSFVRTGGGDD